MSQQTRVGGVLGDRAERLRNPLPRRPIPFGARRGDTTFVEVTADAVDAVPGDESPHDLAHVGRSFRVWYTGDGLAGVRVAENAVPVCELPVWSAGLAVGAHRPHDSFPSLLDFFLGEECVEAGGEAVVAGCEVVGAAGVGPENAAA